MDSAFAPDWSNPHSSSNGLSTSGLPGLSTSLSTIGYSVEPNDYSYDLPTPTATQNPNISSSSTIGLGPPPIHLSESIGDCHHQQQLSNSQSQKEYDDSLTEKVSYEDSYQTSVQNMSLNYVAEDNGYPLSARDQRFESVSLGNNTLPASFAQTRTKSRRINPASYGASQDLPPNINSQSQPDVSSNSDLQDQQTDSSSRRPDPKPSPSSSSNSDPGASTQPAAIQTSSTYPSKQVSSDAPVSKMAAPPKPAEKSKTGKKAVAAIKGGGGLGAKGTKANVLQQVISRTRPKDLPPKPQEEDQKHLREFEMMMVASQEIQKRQLALEAERRLAHEQLMTSYQPAWENEVLPNWKSVLRDDPSGKSLRNMWWLGTMPPRHRGRLWHQCIGNAGAVGRSAFMKSVALAKSMINSTPTRYPPEVLQAIDKDIAQTLPKLKLFQEGKPMHNDFKQILLAWSVFWRERPYYPLGSSWLAGLFLINMTPADAFLSLVNITRKSCLTYFYNGKQAEVEAFYRIFDTLLAEAMPKIYRNFQLRDIKGEDYLREWITTVYIRILPFELATRIMDIFVLEGDAILFRVGLAILEILECRLMNPDRLELLMILKGEDRGSRAIVIRNSISLYGERKHEEVGIEESFEEMGCDERNLFEKLMEREWNQALWERLVTRELPD